MQKKIRIPQRYSVVTAVSVAARRLRTRKGKVRGCISSTPQLKTLRNTSESKQDIWALAVWAPLIGFENYACVYLRRAIRPNIYSENNGLLCHLTTTIMRDDDVHDDDDERQRCSAESYYYRAN